MNNIIRTYSPFIKPIKLPSSSEIPEPLGRKELSKSSIYRILHPQSNLFDLLTGAVIRWGKKNMVAQNAVFGTGSRVQADTEVVQTLKMHGVCNVG